MAEADSEPRYILFRNGSDEHEYEDLKDKIENRGINYEEVDDEGYFTSKPLSGPVLGVKTSIGYLPHDGWDRINEVLSELEDESIDPPERAQG